MQRLRALLMLGAGTVVGGGGAWLAGGLAPMGAPSPLMDPAAISDSVKPEALKELSALSQSVAPEASAAAVAAPAEAGSTAAPATAAPSDAPADVPVFDIVRVQPDGSLVIAGRSKPGASIDIVAGDKVIGSTSSDESGAFAFVLDNPLTPGSYDIGLVAKTGGETSASAERAVVQVPDRADGEVLAVVTTPGAASEVVAAGNAPAPATITSPATTDEQAAVAATTAPPPAAEPAAAPAAAAQAASVEPRVAAVEIEGGQLVVSGTAAPDGRVRIYVDDAVVGDAVVGADGAFALLSQFNVDAGGHALRVDALDPATGAVTARAAVPFERPEGEAVAVAATPGESQQPLVPQPDFALGDSLSGTRAATSVVIRKGDTLWQISRKVYGRGIRFSTIYNANARQIADPDRIWPGQVFVMPPKTEDGADADFSGIGDRKQVNIVSD